jgi:hypothetical protein
MIKALTMSEIYAMQRANGDVFALDHHGRFRVPLFHSSRDAMIARSRNWEMLLFKPIPLDDRLLKELVPIGCRSEVDFWLVNDPLANLNRGHLVEHAQLAVLMHTPIELQMIPPNGNRLDTAISSTLPQSAFSAIETWENEGGNYSKRAGRRYKQMPERRRIHEDKSFQHERSTLQGIHGVNS